MSEYHHKDLLRESLDTKEEVNAALQGFIAWKAERNKTAKKRTESDFLNQYRTCGHCSIQGFCSKNAPQWEEEWAIEDERRLLVNRPKNYGGFYKCCRWDEATWNMVSDELAAAKLKGDVE